VKLSSFDFPLPEHLIAQHPLPERDQSRLMVVRRAGQTVEHRVFRDLPDILGPGQFLVVNSTRVFPARLWACRPGKQERIEILLVREESPGVWLALTRPARKTKQGQEIDIGELRAKVREIRPGGSRLLEFSSTENLSVHLARL
jgi:S-adenosylmethionine:tRNA ribosyltransferase-isomerase